MVAPILISLAYYLSVFTACELGRRLAWRLLPSSAVPFVLDALGTLQICTCVYENALVVRYYGVQGFFCAVVCLVTAHSFLNRGASVLPTAALEEALLRGRIRQATRSLLAQMVGGYGAFRLAKAVWWLHLSGDHARQWSAYPCALSWRVPLWLFCAYEVGGSFLIRSIVGRASPGSRRYVAAVVQATLLSIEFAFLGPPGLNPIIAASRLLGCEGLSLRGHLFIYWLCPFLGWLAAAKLHQDQSQSAQPSQTTTAPPKPRTAPKDTKAD